jgi:hypothetical protein
VDGYGDCIWLRAYERLKHEGSEQDLLKHAPVVQNQGLRGTSAWANFWLGRDHAVKRASARKAPETSSDSSPKNPDAAVKAKEVKKEFSNTP